jgi:hypothetical protein
MQSVDKQRELSKAAHKSHLEREQMLAEEGEKKAKTKKIVGISISVCGVIIIALIAWFILKPGPYDSFAKCLSEKGAVMQGEDWCQYTNAQKAMFGKSFKHINYEINPNLQTRPTWIINGEQYSTVQSFERLSALTGCEI